MRNDVAARLTHAPPTASIKKAAVIGLGTLGGFFKECSMIVNNGREIVKTLEAGR
jgi:hypothetical protein